MNNPTKPGANPERVENATSGSGVTRRRDPNPAALRVVHRSRCRTCSDATANGAAYCEPCEAIAIDANLAAFVHAIRRHTSHP